MQSVDVGDINETLTSQAKQQLTSTQSSNVITEEHLQHNITQVCSDPQLTTATILTSIDISGHGKLNKTDSKTETTVKVGPQLTQEEQTDNDNQQNIKNVTKSSNTRQNTKTDTSNKLETILSKAFNNKSKVRPCETALPKDMRELHHLVGCPRNEPTL